MLALGDALAVTQVDEDESAMVAAPIDPAGKSYRSSVVFFAQVTAIMSLEQNSLLRMFVTIPELIISYCR